MLLGEAMKRSIGTWIRIRRARRQRWDADIIRALQIPVPRFTQERARQLIQQGKWQEAITEIREATDYDRRDARCVVLALTYGCKVPTPAAFLGLRGDQP
ncbi:hypothetical protein JCM4814A_73680 [Streptomyces phaeofaciens JCM 4814]|uniref:Uncharacterized protein n=1 Tax=Streptomyces phaeofaciens TaxID=68254 RepID=A0A918HHS4_9ACTN|nr:hypothetical protein GCM10010226_46140 [Streptomyces phaeofaciens]